ncbi:MAG: aldehyde dehydrogenase family protein, partial [Cellvibrionaceae bacterium]|nr:aldehyde dehydrogenase family protein [Cellvibrionaceae bacterium]
YLPPGVLNVVTGDGDIGGAMTRHADIDKIVFTGSTATGKKIMEGASVNLKRLTLELGGNDAGIILPDVDVKAMAPRIFAAAFTNSGQTCAALKRLYVHESIHDELAAELVAIAKAAKVGNGLEEGMDYGPVNNLPQLQKVQALAADAKANGAEFLIGGDEHQGKGYFYPLTIVSNVKDGMPLVDEEPFGPILPIIKFTDTEEVIRLANDNSNGLGGSVWSADIAKAAELASRLESGTAWINNHAAIQPNVPFGGIKQSGFGVEFASQGLEEYTSIQSVIIAKQ